jgi:hypothetical protein
MVLQVMAVAAGEIGIKTRRRSQSGSKGRLMCGT